MRATAILRSHQYMHQAALFEREKGRADSLHLEGQYAAEGGSFTEITSFRACQKKRRV
jgi:hypothetical protein